MAKSKAKKDTFKEVVDKLWPKTKKELEKAVKSTRKLIDKGENYLKAVSEKGIDNTKVLALSLKKEKLYYALGKQIVQLPKGKWSRSAKINALMKEIKAVDKEIKKLK